LKEMQDRNFLVYMNASKRNNWILLTKYIEFDLKIELLL